MELNKIISQYSNTGRMPVLFIGHGSPMNAIEENEFVRGWREVGASLPKPNAIICVSAHWETRGTFVTAVKKPVTIHDFGGFPRPLFEVQYPAPGNPELAGEVKNQIIKTQIGLDERWGLDHGAWSVISRMYPGAEIPVIELSLDYTQSADYHYELGRELSPFRNKGVLIIGSGNMVHNLRLAAWDRLNDSEYGYDWALEAREQMKNFILEGDHHRLVNFREQGSAYNLAIPTPEHYLPLLYTMALKEKDEQVSLFNDKPIAGSLTMTSVKISL